MPGYIISQCSFFTLSQPHPFKLSFSSSFTSCDKTLTSSRSAIGFLFITSLYQPSSPPVSNLLSSAPSGSKWARQSQPNTRRLSLRRRASLSYSKMSILLSQKQEKYSSNVSRLESVTPMPILVQALWGLCMSSATSIMIPLITHHDQAKDPWT